MKWKIRKTTAERLMSPLTYPTRTGARRSRDPIHAPRHVLLKLRAILGALLIYGGIGAYLILGDILSFQELLFRHSRELVAVPLMLIGTYLFMIEFMKSKGAIRTTICRC